MSDSAIVTAKIIVEGNTTYKVYFSDAECLKDRVHLRGDYRISILAEDDLQRFLKKYNLGHDPAEIAVVSYTKIEKEKNDPFAFSTLTN